MKKTMIFWVAICLALTCVNAQTIKTPEKVGEVHLLLDDGTTIPLIKEATQMKTGGGIGSMVPLVGKTKTYLTMKGAKSKARIQYNGSPVKLVVKVGEETKNVDDWMTIMSFESKKKERRYMTTEGSLLGGIKSEGFVSLPYKAEKVAEQTYVFTFEAAPGEYGIMVSEMEDMPSAYLMYQTFGVDE